MARRSNIAVATLLVMLTAQGPIWGAAIDSLKGGRNFAVVCMGLYPGNLPAIQQCVSIACGGLHFNEGDTVNANCKENGRKEYNRRIRKIPKKYKKSPGKLISTDELIQNTE